MTDLPRCDQDVYDHGHHVMTIHTIPAKDVEEFVRELSQRSKQRVDWHYFGGRGIVKALGNIQCVDDVIYEMLEENPDVARFAHVS